LIKATRKTFANVLLLDAGNSIYGTDGLAAQSQGKVMVDAMNLMGYDAMTIGNVDLFLGTEVLKQRIAESKFAVVSANLTLASTGKLLAQPYVIREVGGRKVGIIGLTGSVEQPNDVAEIKGKYVLLKTDDVLAKYVREVSKKTDFIIVLSNMGEEEDERLSSLVPGIDLIVGGQSQTPMTTAWHNEQTGTYVVQAGSRGEWIGRRYLHLDSLGKVDSFSDELIFLTEDYADDPDMRTFLGNYKTP